MTHSGTIGIVGGGQLGRMLTEAAQPLGFKVIVVDPNDNCPATQAGAEQIKANFYDAGAIKAMAAKADFVTIESEHVNTKVLSEVAGQGTPVNPAAKTISLIQDKLAQKQFLQQQKIPVAGFAPITDRASAEKLLHDWGTIYIKTTHGGFDGRGNALIKDPGYLSSVMATAGDQGLYAERAVPLKKELAVMVARDFQGNVKTYPVTETIHSRSICVETLTPAPVNEAIAHKATKLALQVAGHLEGAGVFGIEMFLTDDDQILINEVAPRVHNSGHYTIEACQTSQFEQHIRAITGLPLGPTEMIVPAAAMINILGKHNRPVQLEGLEQASSEPHTTVHIYGKSPTKIDRKMGHITATGETLQEAQERVRKARAAISI